MTNEKILIYVKHGNLGYRLVSLTACVFLGINIAFSIPAAAGRQVRKFSCTIDPQRLYEQTELACG